MLMALMVVMVSSPTVASIRPYYQGFVEAVSTVSQLATVIVRETPINGTDGTMGEKPSSVVGNVSLESVKLIYPSKPDVTVVDNVTLSFEAGKVTALVGASGSGKALLSALSSASMTLFRARGSLTAVVSAPTTFAGSVSRLDMLDRSPACLLAQCLATFDTA
jgi:ABC-type multidrug transport system fused ATPase/permease subunit